MATPGDIYESVEMRMIMLYTRWQDEKDYEDIHHYAHMIAPKVNEMGGQFLKMYKRPFGFTYIVDGKTYKVSMNSKTYGFKRIK